MAENRLRLRMERGKEELRSKLVGVEKQQRELRELCEQLASEQAAVRVAELETKATISRQCSEIGRSLALREHEAKNAVVRAEADEREILERRSRASSVRREALDDAVAHGVAALSVPDGTDFIARSLSAIALLDAELAIPPGDARTGIDEDAAGRPIRDLLRSSFLLPGDTATPAEGQGRLACDVAHLTATAATAVQSINAIALPVAPSLAANNARAPAVTIPRPDVATDIRHFGGHPTRGSLSPMEPLDTTVRATPARAVATAPAALVDNISEPESSLPRSLRDELTAMKQEAASGDPDALYRVGCCLQHGLGTEQGSVDLPGAIKYYHAAAEQEHAASQFALGYCLQSQGDGGKGPLSWFRRAAANGHAQAQCALACCLLSGDFTGAAEGSDPMALEIEAVELFSAAAGAEPPLVEAQYNLAACYVAGTGGARNLAKARGLYLAAATAGDAAAQCALGDLLAGYHDVDSQDGGNGAKAGQGSEQAAVELEEACRWWAQAADSGVGLAALRLGSVAEGREDFRTAVEWYMTAVDAQPPVEGLHEALERALGHAMPVPAPEP